MKSSVLTTNTVGLLLILLSLMSYYLAESSQFGSQQTSLLMCLAVCKSIFIGGFFMDLLHKHKLILLAFSLCFVFLGGLLALIFTL